MKKNDEEEFELEETEIKDEDIVNPGDCIGHWDEKEEACEICEIQDSCKNMTLSLKENSIEK